MSIPSLVLQFPAPDPEQSAAFMQAKLAYHTDSADLAQDLLNGVNAIVVIDTRSPDLYAAGHIPGAISFPHRTMDDHSTSSLERGKTYVVYCDGIGCNGSTKGAWKLARLGFKVKELLGGLDFWKRDGHPLATGMEPGRLGASAQCGC
ncbi:rhodanese-like domain-containing protein [Massilia sp. ST3]|uniref:rhodanese-like domain-containing protein n=1 Tax=Massilia sp. ST3 TaxID=2824903 RepID=UPI001B837B80|nr:rhodanese-like domain-containing protein [Massilia sp. ST3]MBQ5947506.1 rhodanese-like domain-containing protein [Massilia sp. ST3]